MADNAHEHGSMDTAEQEKTFQGFIKFGIWLVIVSVVVVIPTVLALA